MKYDRRHYHTPTKMSFLVAFRIRIQGVGFDSKAYFWYNNNDFKKQMEENINQKETKITITMPTNAYFMSGIRDFTLNMVKNTTNFSEKWAFRFQSVIDELCNNAIEHGSSPGSEIRITFIHKKDEYLEILVEDTGSGKNKINAEKLRKIYEERKTPGYAFTGIRGRGLVKIVGEWTDEINFIDRPEGGIRVKVKKFLKDQRYNEAGIPKINNNIAIKTN